VTKLGGAETFRITNPNCVGPAGESCNADFTLNGIGTNTEYLVNILENVGGPLSDQVHVFRPFGGGTIAIDFISDPATFVTAGPGAVITTIVETGSLQPVLTYTAMNGVTVNNIFALSDLGPDAEVPEPDSMLRQDHQPDGERHKRLSLFARGAAILDDEPHHHPENAAVEERNACVHRVG